MSETTKGGGAPADNGGAGGGTGSNGNANPDLERALADLHKFKAKAKDLETKLSAVENDKLMAEGKKDELITSLNKQINELKTKNSEMQKTYANDKVQAWLKTKAAASGIISEGGAVDKFASLINFEGRNPFRDDSTFALDENVLSEVFEKHKKEMPYFFTKQSPNIKDVNLGSAGAPEQTNGNDYSKLSLDQMREKARNISNQTQ